MYELQVEGMRCEHCISKVTRFVKQIDDTAKVDIDLATKKVRVESAAEIEDVCAAITDAGYPAQGRTGGVTNKRR